MNRRNRISGFAAALLAAATLAITSTASAQAIFNNPPCTSVALTNNSGCTVRVNFTTIPVGVWPPTVLPPGATVLLPVPGAVNVTGIRSLAGVVYPVNPPPPPAFTLCNAGDWWIGNVTLGPAPGCCVDVCLDLVNCRITLWPSAFPPPCRP